jgi:hypothetical protein
MNLRHGNEKPLPCRRGNKSGLFSSSANTVGFGTFPTLQGLPRLHRADPSVALDEWYLFVEYLANMVAQVSSHVKHYRSSETLKMQALLTISLRDWANSQFDCPDLQ